MSTYRVKSACLISLWKTKNIWWSVVHLSKLRALIENAMSVSFLFFWIFHTCREYIFANQMSHFCSHLFFLMISSHPIILFCLSLVHCILRPTKFLSTATHKGMNVGLSSGIWTNCQGLHHWRQSLSFPSVFIKCQWLPKGKLGPQRPLLHHAMRFTNLTLYVRYAGHYSCCETRRALGLSSTQSFATFVSIHCFLHTFQNHYLNVTWILKGVKWMFTVGWVSVLNMKLIM